MQADSQPKSSGLVLGRRPLGAILRSSNEPGELSQWLCRDDSTINIVVVIIIIIIIINYADDAVLFTDDPTKWDFFLEILRHQQALWVSKQTGIKRRSKILELEMLQEQSILTIKQ